MAQITLNSTGVASNGALVLQSNGTTTAVTIDTSQRAAFVAGTAALPAITTTGDTNTGIFFPAADTIAFSEGGAEAMRIDSSSRVLIGSTSSVGNANANNLELTNPAGSGVCGLTLNVNSASANTGNIYWRSNASNNNIQIVGDPITNYFAVATAGIERMRIDASGDVGIGTTSPQSTVGVNVALADTKGVVLQYNGEAKGGILLNPTAGEVRMGSINATGTYFTSLYSNNSERMRIDSSGNLLVGTTSAVLSGKITSSFAGNTINGATFNDTTSGSGAGFCIFSIGGTAIGNISRVGSTSAVAYNTTSDQRLKSNIADSQSVLDKLMAVKVRQFDWTGGNLHQDYGFIAQELEPTLSGIVSKGKTDEDMWQLDYAKLTPHLVKAIQELKALTDTQAETINALTARIVALESK